MTEVRIKHGDVALTPEVQGYVHEWVEKLQTLSDRILTFRVTIEAPSTHHRQGGPYEVHIDMDLPGHVITVNQRAANDLHVAIRQAFEAARAQLGDFEEKRRETARQRPS